MIKLAGIEVDEAKLRDVCRQWGIAELSVFGFVARGESAPDSDIDLLYVFEPDARIGWNIVDLEEELSNLFGRKVDLVSKHQVHRLVREEVLQQARVLYVA